MNSILVPCLVGAFICHVTKAAVVIPLPLPVQEGCEHAGMVYAAGEPFLMGCDARCRCNKDKNGFYVSCVPMCNHTHAPGCKEVYKPTRNESTSTDCCPEYECPQGCEHDGKVYAAGEPFSMGCAALCRCNEGKEGFNMSCVSMCPPKHAPGCTEVYKSTRNESTSTDCCPEYECPPGV